MGVTKSDPDPGPPIITHHTCPNPRGASCCSDCQKPSKTLLSLPLEKLAAAHFCGKRLALLNWRSSPQLADRPPTSSFPLLTPSLFSSAIELEKWAQCYCCCWPVATPPTLRQLQEVSNKTGFCGVWFLEIWRVDLWGQLPSSSDLIGFGINLTWRDSGSSPIIDLFHVGQDHPINQRTLRD